MLFAEFNPSTWTTPALAAALTLAVLMRLRGRHQIAKPGTRKTAEPIVEQTTISAHAVVDDRRLVEFYETAREIEARLDMKRALLEQLIAAADERIDELRQLEADSKATSEPAN
ncbi:MAG: hypothetical protein JNK76_10865 [Planctomycetales bacterium]|nr:hypothetical protein [Planctomycetales bacterium]MBN8626840.1 hypothetical protein [Planctomycetota bacterium]